MRVLRSPSRVTCVWSRTPRCSTSRSGRSGCRSTPGCRGRCRGWSVSGGRPSCCCARARCRRPTRWLLGSRHELVPAAELAARAAAVAAELAAGPDHCVRRGQAGACLRRRPRACSTHSTSKPAADLGRHDGGSRRRGARVPREADADFRAAARTTPGSASRTQLADVARHQVIVDHAGRLHVRVRRRRTDEAQSRAA